MTQLSATPPPAAAAAILSQRLTLSQLLQPAVTNVGTINCAGYKHAATAADLRRYPKAARPLRPLIGPGLSLLSIALAIMR
jgi:hypothetical protein